MTEVKTFKQKDLVLHVDRAYNPLTLDLDAWRPFLDRLCGDRAYQKEAIETAVLYLAAGNHHSLAELAEKNYAANAVLREKYPTIEAFRKVLQLPDQLYATLDLATGTGKSYVIYGIAQIMLGLGLVDRVLVLCPSLTIEAGLTEKFVALSGDAALKAQIPATASVCNPRIVSADRTVLPGDVCVENIHAVYENTGSSIADSFGGSGERVLVLNDEAHHIFNKAAGTAKKDQNIKRWKGFLQDAAYGFRYILGFTGTAYIEDEYFADVICRYSLRQAIEDHVVKNIDYIREDDSKDDDERLQKIYQNHLENIHRYPQIKPLTILVNSSIAQAKELARLLTDFLGEQIEGGRAEAEKKVLVVTSHPSHSANVARLPLVDDSDDPTEWIVSVSMLTEGWDVKNVLQIVPWRDRAFHSKLLIAQVLGRGLRLPVAYRNPVPRVTVFNHRSWSGKIRRLVDEVLEIETRVSSVALSGPGRADYHFVVRNMRYKNILVETETPTAGGTLDFSRLLRDGILLVTQKEEEEKGATYDAAVGGESTERSYTVRHSTWTVEDVLDKLFDEFEQRDWEGRVLKLGEREYTQELLPPRADIRALIELSMKKRGNRGVRIVEKNVHHILNAFAPLLRRKSKSVASVSRLGEFFEVDTRKLEAQSTGIGNLRRGHTVFYTGSWREEVADEEQRAVMEDLIEDESLPRSALKEKSVYLLKTPVTTVLTASEPERKFVQELCKKETARIVTAWVKSRDRHFYEIEYSYRYGSADSNTRKYFHGRFNPDFFILAEWGGVRWVLVVEIKADGDVCEENRAKLRHARQHVNELNERLAQEGICERYIFHILSPEAYATFFSCLQDGTLFAPDSTFTGELERMLEAEEPAEDAPASAGQ